MEVSCQGSSLRSRAVMVLLNAQRGLVYTWKGCKSHASAREVAKRAVDTLTQRWVQTDSSKSDHCSCGRLDPRCSDCGAQAPPGGQPRYWTDVSPRSRRPSELGLSGASRVKAEEVDEGAEPAELLEALSMKDRKVYDCMLQGSCLSAVAVGCCRSRCQLMRCVVFRPREVQLHPPAVPAERQLGCV